MDSRTWISVGVAILALGAIGNASAQDEKALPSAKDLVALLKSEPINENTWPKWKERLSTWIHDPPKEAKPVTDAAIDFLFSLTLEGNGRLPPRFDDDHIAWFVYGIGLAYGPIRGAAVIMESANAFQRSIAIRPTFAPAHRELGKVYLDLNSPDWLDRADQAFKEAARLDPLLPMDLPLADLASRRGNYEQAVTLYEVALKKDPTNVTIARIIALNLLVEKMMTHRASRMESLVKQFPNEGRLAALNARLLSELDRPKEAYAELKRARSLLVDPEYLPADEVKVIEDRKNETALGRWLAKPFGTFTAIGAVLATVAVAVIVARCRARKGPISVAK